MLDLLENKTDFFRVSTKIVITRNLSFVWHIQKQPFGGVLYKRCTACNFIKKESLAQVFSCEFSEISKNTSFTFFFKYFALHQIISTGNSENA